MAQVYSDLEGLLSQNFRESKAVHTEPIDLLRNDAWHNYRYYLKKAGEEKPNAAWSAWRDAAYALDAAKAAINNAKSFSPEVRETEKE
jgi:hypothetical protein